MTVNLHIGTMGWSYDFWVGNFYNMGTASQEFLSEYVKVFNSVEIDSTFYRIPSPTVVMNWRSQAGLEFRFCAKFPGVITHEKMLKDCEDDVELFIRNISLLKDRLGPLLIQFPYSFKPTEFGLLRDFLSSLPKENRFAVEVKNKKWLDNRFYKLLRSRDISLALIDHPWMPEMNEVTADFTYIRWEGDRKKIKGTTGKVERDRGKEIENWAFKIENLLADDIEVFGYFSKHYSGHSPSDAKKLLQTLK
jgi:uncharacterized protein YecE (DUF72 family)